MTPDLERAAKAIAPELWEMYPSDDMPARASCIGSAQAVLRALENLSPEVVEAMKTALVNVSNYWLSERSDGLWCVMHHGPNGMVIDGEYRDEQTAMDMQLDFVLRSRALAAWRAGLNAILAAEGKDASS